MRPGSLVALLLLVPLSTARADLASAEDKLLHGDYAAAIRAFRGVKGKDASRASVRMGALLLRTGDLAGAEAAALSGAKSADRQAAADAAVLLAEVARATGKNVEARKILEELVKKERKHLRARALLALLYDDIGEPSRADKLWNLFYDDFDAGAIDTSDGEQLLYVALGQRGLGDYKGASETFGDAISASPNLLEANVWWGNIFLEKYAAGEAEQSFQEVLKTDPHHPDALAGMARVRLEQNYDIQGALDFVTRALATNPRSAEALAVRATVEIDNEQHADADKTLGEILAQNPNDLTARSMRAAIRWLDDDLAGYEAEKKKVFAQNPKYAAFFHIVADFAVKEHRYKEAIVLEEQAVQVDPKYYLALAAVGLGYLRLGEEPKGLEYLNKAFAEDAFNVRAYNTLELFDGAIPKSYEFVASKHFKIRVAKEEKSTLARYVPRTLETAFADMVKRYGFTPQAPVIVELYADPDHYSVRTVGLPRLGALGVCFGRVITAMSPSNGNINWGMVLWHELGHVFAIQLSKNRVPRWFTEGLSEYETILARPEWRRENDVDVWTALAAGKLPSVLDLNSRFLRARDMQDMVVAYHMSSLAVEFLGTRWGFPKIVRALELYGQGKTTAQVLPSVTGLDIASFDAELRKHLEQRLAAYKGTFRINLAEYRDLTALEKTAAARPTDADAQASLALAYLASGEPAEDEAQAAAARALALDSKNKKAIWVQAAIAGARGDRTGVRERTKALIAAGGDGYGARLQLARLALEDKDAKTAEAELERAKKLDPERSEPYQLLADLFSKNNREDDALRELERYAYLEQMEYRPVKTLVDKYAARKNWAKVDEFGRMALFINPYDADLHVTVAQAYLSLGRPDDAIGELEGALASDPPLRRPAVAHLGLARAYVAKKDLKKARSAIAAAFREEPKNAEVLELKARIK